MGTARSPDARSPGHANEDDAERRRRHSHAERGNEDWAEGIPDMKRRIRLSSVLLLMIPLAIGFAFFRESPGRRERDNCARLVADWRLRLDRTRERKAFCLTQPPTRPYRALALNLDYRMGVIDGNSLRPARTWAEEAGSLDRTVDIFTEILGRHESYLRSCQQRLILPF